MTGALETAASLPNQGGGWVKEVKLYLSSPTLHYYEMINSALTVRTHFNMVCSPHSQAVRGVWGNSVT